MRQNAREQHPMMALHASIQGFAQVWQPGEAFDLVLALPVTRDRLGPRAYVVHFCQAHRWPPMPTSQWPPPALSVAD